MACRPGQSAGGGNNWSISGAKKKETTGQSLTSTFLTIIALSQYCLEITPSVSLEGYWPAKTGCFCYSLAGITLFSGISRLRKYKQLPSSTFPHSRKDLSLLYLYLPPLLVQPTNQYPPTALVQLWTRCWWYSMMPWALLMQELVLEALAMYAPRIKIAAHELKVQRASICPWGWTQKVVNDFKEGKDPSSPLRQAAD